jgi:hypothetical protein
MFFKWESTKSTQVAQIMQNMTTNEAMNWGRYAEWRREDGF